MYSFHLSFWLRTRKIQTPGAEELLPLIKSERPTINVRSFRNSASPFFLVGVLVLKLRLLAGFCILGGATDGQK